MEDWRWAVVFPDGQELPATLIRRHGHARWDQETRGFGELTQRWHLNHCYRHHPVARMACLHLARLLADDLARGGRESFWARAP